MSVAIDYTSGAFAANKAQSVGTITGSTLDVSSGQYFEFTPTANTTFAFSNAPASGTAAGFALAVTGANVVSGYDLGNASYDSVSFSVAGQDGTPVGLFFKPDGTSLYIAGQTTGVIYQYSLSTAWDLSTASYSSISFSVSSQVTNLRGLQLSSDGTKMFVLDSILDAVFQYSLSTAWDISTASYDSVSLSVTFASNGSFCLSSDGLKLYLVDESDDVDQYNLSTAWDVSTATYAATETDLFIAQETSPSGLFFSPSGDKLFCCGYGSDVVAQATLSTPFDITTATPDSTTFSVSGQDSLPYGVFFKSDGSKMYIVGLTNDTIHQYTTGASAPATFTYPSSVDWPSGTAPDAPAVGETDVLVFYTEDGGTTYYGFQAGDAMS